MTEILSVQNLSKRYDSGFQALDDVCLDVHEGEILALLGPNGAGKTTLISTICGIHNVSSGKVLVGGYDIRSDFRKTRSIIGLVPQELMVEMFETVWDTVSFSRGLFGKAKNPAYIEKILKSLSLWDKKDEQLRALSGGMKRRVLIAKALSHEPKLLFLDEPTAGVDVALRKDMWQIVAQLKQEGVTIILTTHYIEEAEAIADRIGVINKGKILLVEDKDVLMQKMGKKQLMLEVQSPLEKLPESLISDQMHLSEDGYFLTYTYDRQGERTGIGALMVAVQQAGIRLKDVQTSQSSLEEIFVSLVEESV